MSHRTQSASALLPVAFQGTTLYIVDHGGEPFTPMRPIVEGMGLAWQSQHVKLTANQERWGVTEIMTPSNGGLQKSLCMPVRKLPAFFANISVNKVAPELRDRIRAYQAECDDALWAYWTQRRGQAQPPAISAPPPSPNTCDRWLATHSGERWVLLEIPKDAAVLPMSKWPSVIRTTDFPRHLLTDVLAAVSARLQEIKP